MDFDFGGAPQGLTPSAGRSGGLATAQSLTVWRSRTTEFHTRGGVMVEPGVICQFEYLGKVDALVEKDSQQELKVHKGTGYVIKMGRKSRVIVQLCTVHTWILHVKLGNSTGVTNLLQGRLTNPSENNVM